MRISQRASCEVKIVCGFKLLVFLREIIMDFKEQVREPDSNTSNNLDLS